MKTKTTIIGAAPKERRIETLEEKKASHRTMQSEDNSIEILEALVKVTERRLAKRQVEQNELESEILKTEKQELESEILKTEQMLRKHKSSEPHMVYQRELSTNNEFGYSKKLQINSADYKNAVDSNGKLTTSIPGLKVRTNILEDIAKVRQEHPNIGSSDLKAKLIDEYGYSNKRYGGPREQPVLSRIIQDDDQWKTTKVIALTTAAIITPGALFCLYGIQNKPKYDANLASKIYAINYCTEDLEKKRLKINNEAHRNGIAIHDQISSALRKYIENLQNTLDNLNKGLITKKPELENSIKKLSDFNFRKYIENLQNTLDNLNKGLITKTLSDLNSQLIIKQEELENSIKKLSDFNSKLITKKAEQKLLLEAKAEAEKALNNKHAVDSAGNNAVKNQTHAARVSLNRSSISPERGGSGINQL